MNEYGFTDKRDFYEMIHSHESCESTIDVQKRVKEWINELKAGEYLSICVISHGGTGRAIRSILMNDGKDPGMDNCAISIFENTEEGRSEVVANDVSHLL